MSTAGKREELLSMLLSKKYVDKSELQEKLGLTNNQVNVLVADVNTIYDGILKVSSVDESNVTVAIKDKGNLFNTLQFNLQQDFNKVEFRVAYLLYRLICTEEYLNIGDLSEDMCVSRSTVNNDIKKTKIILEKYNAKIIGVPNKGITFKSSEFGTRLVLIYEVYDLLQMTFLLDEEMQGIIERLISGYKLDEQSKELLHKTVVISVHRIIDGNVIDCEIPLYKNFERDAENMNEYFQLIEDRYHISLNDYEMDFLSFPINTRNSAYVKNPENTANEQALRAIVSSMLETVRDQVMIDIEEEAFFNKVKDHLLFLVNRLVFRIPKTDLYFEQIKLRYPLAFELAKISLKELNRLYQLSASDDDISYFAIYYALILDERQAYDSDEKAATDVGIITNVGRGNFELISRQIKEIVGNDRNIIHLSTSDLQEEKLKRFKLLFTTENILNNADMPIIQIDRVVNQDELVKKIYAIEKDQYSIKYISNNNISYHVKNLTGQMGYFDYVEEIMNYLSKRYKLSDDILDRFIEKEERHTMIYENRVAFPHLTDPNIDKLIFVLGKIKSEKRNDGFSLMLFLVTPEKITEQQEKILMQVYDFVFKVINDTVLIDKIQQISDVQGFIEMLEKRGTQ